MNLKFGNLSESRGSAWDKSIPPWDALERASAGDIQNQCRGQSPASSLQIAPWSLLQLKSRLRQQYQVICIKQLPWQAFFEIVSYGLHYNVKQDWTKYRSLVYPHLDLKTFTLFTIPFDRCSNPLIQTFNHIYHPLFHSNMPQSPPQNLTRHPIEGLLQVYKSHPQLLLLAK